jgi:hypothetical protein
MTVTGLNLSTRRRVAYALGCHRTQTSVVWGRRLTVWVMARPLIPWECLYGTWQDVLTESLLSVEWLGRMMISWWHTMNCKLQGKRSCCNWCQSSAVLEDGCLNILPAAGFRNGHLTNYRAVSLSSYFDTLHICYVSNPSLWNVSWQRSWTRHPPSRSGQQLSCFVMGDPCFKSRPGDRPFWYELPLRFPQFLLANT